MLGALALIAWLAAGPLSVATHIECGGADERCKAVETVLSAAIKAEGMTARTGAGCGESVWATDCLELRAKVGNVPVFFELRDAKGLRIIASTDVPEYRAKYGTQDALLIVAFMTVAFAPLAYDLHTPTSRADEERAWMIMARRVLRHGGRGGSTYFGAREVRGRHWTVAMDKPDVRRVRQPEPDAVIVESSYEPVVPDSDEAREGMYTAGLVLSHFVSALDQVGNLTVGDGRLKLIVIHDPRGHFGARVIVRDNPALNGNREFMSALHGAIFLTSAVPLSGYTRIEIPLTVRRAAKK